MNISIDEEWARVLAPEFEQPYFNNLIEFVDHAYATETIYPPEPNIFNAFSLCPFNKVKVVILGQDPYHGEGQAHGLAFSVPENVTPPPSLKNIYKELLADLGVPITKSGNLEHWATQGVLLLNSTLTVQAGLPGSHQGKGWEKFTDRVISLLSTECEHVVFMLWGNYAKKKGAQINRAKHLVLEAAHPSPLGAYKGFFGCKHFSKANEYLQLHNKGSITW